ncbi:MAG TPA: RNA polymerase sigma factor [Humisphaera sp.]
MDGSELRCELERLHGESFGWATCCCGADRHRAEDVLQEVYVKVLDGRARYDGRGSVKTWLFAVIRLTAADARRRDLVRRLRLRFYEPTSREPEPADRSVGRSEDRDRFRAALAALPARQQQVLHLVFYHDLSLAAAADVMGVSLGTARTHYDRGKKAVRRTLEEDDDATGTRPGAFPGVVL